MNFFDAGTLETQTQGLANLYPNDRPFYAKNISDSNLRKLLTGLAQEIWRAEKRVQDITVQHYIPDTVDLIEAWESAVGIPDSCFLNTRNLEQRQKNVLTKFKALGVATKESFIQLAAFMGYTIEIITFSAAANPPYNVPFYPVLMPLGRFVWLIKGIGIAPYVPPYDVPFDVNIGSDVLPCFFSKLKPANTILYFENLPPV